MKSVLSIPDRLAHQRSSFSLRPGVTLLEVLIATVLTLLLMTALTGVIRQMRQSRDALTLSESTHWQLELQRQLRWDLQNARSLVTYPYGFTLYGYGGRDWNTGELVLRPSEVLYRVEWRGEDPVLLREEKELNRSLPLKIHRELVAVGIGGIRLGRLEDSSLEIAQRLDPVDTPVATTVPARMRVVLLDRSWKLVQDTAVFQPR